MNGIWPCAVGRRRLTRLCHGTAGMYNFVCYVSGFVSRTQHSVRYIMTLWNLICIPATVLWQWLLKRRANIAFQFFIVIPIVFPNPSSRVRFPAERLFFLIICDRRDSNPGCRNGFSNLHEFVTHDHTDDCQCSDFRSNACLYSFVKSKFTITYLYRTLPLVFITKPYTKF